VDSAGYCGRMTQGLGTKTRGGLKNRGNRALLGVGVGLVVQIFAGLLGADAVTRYVLWVVSAAIVYAVTGR